MRWSTVWFVVNTCHFRSPRRFPHDPRWVTFLFMKGAIHLCFSCRCVPDDGLIGQKYLGHIMFHQDSCNCTDIIHKLPLIPIHWELPKAQLTFKRYFFQLRSKNSTKTFVTFRIQTGCLAGEKTFVISLKQWKTVVRRCLTRASSKVQTN